MMRGRFELTCLRESIKKNFTKTLNFACQRKVSVSFQNAFFTFLTCEERSVGFIWPLDLPAKKGEGRRRASPQSAAGFPAVTRTWEPRPPEGAKVPQEHTIEDSFQIRQLSWKWGGLALRSLAFARSPWPGSLPSLFSWVLKTRSCFPACVLTALPCGSLHNRHAFVECSVEDVSSFFLPASPVSLPLALSFPAQLSVFFSLHLQCHHPSFLCRS